MFAPEALYFPFTHINRTRLTHACLLFGGIVLYRLPLDPPGDYIQAAMKRNLLRLVEIDLIRDTAEIKRIIDDFSRWAGQHQGQGNIAWLKRQAQETESAETPSRLASSIRGSKTEAGLSRDPDRGAQVVLHLIRYLERQRSEVDQIMERVNRKEDLLMDQIGLEDKSGFSVRADGEAVLEDFSDTDLGLLPQHILAWGRCYLRKSQPGIALFTDRSEVIEYLDRNLVQTGSGFDLNTGRRTEVLEPFFEIKLPCPQGLLYQEDIDFGVIEDYRNRTNELLGPEWAEYIKQVSSKSWSPEELPGLKDRAEALIENLKSDKAVPEEPVLSLTGYLLPGRGLDQALLASIGLIESQNNEGVWSGPVFEISVRKGI